MLRIANILEVTKDLDSTLIYTSFLPNTYDGKTSYKHDFSSAAICFTAPGKVTNLRITDTKPYEVALQWGEPNEKNGAITGYSVKYAGFKGQVLQSLIFFILFLSLRPYCINWHSFN